MTMSHGPRDGPRRRTVLKRLGSIAAVTGIAGCTQGGGGDTTTTTTTTDDGMETTTTTTQNGGSTATVSMVNTSFSPLKLEISTGTEVIWTNDDSFAHTVVAAQFHSAAEQWSFESGSIQAGQSASYTFDSAGIYEYYCDVHGQSTMCGAVLVGDATLSESLPCETDDDGGGGGYY